MLFSQTSLTYFYECPITCEQRFFQGFFRAVKRPKKLNFELSFEAQSSHLKFQCSKNENVIR